MTKHFCKISLCFILSLATLLFAGCNIMDGGSLLEQDETTVTPSPSPEPRPKGIGENWVSDTWEIRLSEVTMVDEVGAEPYNEKAAAGNKLLLLFFDVTNVSESSAYFNNIYFKALVDGTPIMQKVLSPKTIEGRVVAIGSVPAGETARYYIAYEVAENWGVFEISYDIGGMNSNKLADFYIENK